MLYGSELTIMILYDGQLKNYNFSISTKISHHKKKEGEENKKSFCNDIFTFDIETSSGWINEKGEVIPYTAGKSNEYWNSLQPVALCYIWQFSCNGVVYYGRELTDFLKLLKDLPDANIIIWVHNLSFEFHFLANILEWVEVFARSAHKPMKATAKEFPKIQFRCSYMLTRLSLESWGKQIGVEKKSGDLDYDILRTPLTQLTDKELSYCEYDCLVLEAGIKDYLKRYASLWDIPLTQTGTVRRVVKDKLTASDYYVREIKKLIPKDAKEYKRLQLIFSGGYTHANRLYSGKTVTGYIEHYDFASSYPTVMIAEKYPCTKWMYLPYKELPDISMFNDYAYIFELKFTNIHSKSFNTYIQASKCAGSGFLYDNGRVLCADELHITVTEQDYITIKNNYTWDDIEVIHQWRSQKDYLPYEFLNYILELYGNKTSLKNVPGKEDIYLQSKQYINSLFGMSVTAIVQADVTYKNDTWSTEELTAQFVEERLDKLRNWNPREKRYFLSYSWGCWVTAYARRNLWKCVESIDKDVIYCDTDSIFCKGKHDFSWYNEEITEKLKKACEECGLDFEKTRPATPKGVKKPLGVFDKEESCIEFKTLGAKRYVERREDNNLYLTVSGINKEAVDVLNNDISNFSDGIIFDKDHPSVRKKLCTYLLNIPPITWPDGYASNYTKGIVLRNNGYELTMSDGYNKLLKFMDAGPKDLPERFYISMRGRYKGE